MTHVNDINKSRKKVKNTFINVLFFSLLWHFCVETGKISQKGYIAA